MITKIQSFTDVITNSSSTVFVMHQSTAEYYNNLETNDCVDITKIDMDWLQNNPWEVEMICIFLEVSPSEITTYHESMYGDYGWWDTPNQEAWLSFLDTHKEKIEKVFKDLYWVEIEDHFEDAWEVTENAVDDAEWSKSRH